jgi:hypothetical protein
MKHNQTVIIGEIGPSKWQKDDTVYLDIDKQDNSIEKVAQKNDLALESQNKVKVFFVLQTASNPRKIIKLLDSLLKVSSKFEIILVESQAHSGFFRSIEQVKYEFSVSTNGRYILTSSISEDGILHLSYTKKASVLPNHDSIDKWSFGIVSGGSNNLWVRELIESIQSQNIKEYEILICGPTPYSDNDSKPENVILIEDHEMGDDIRVPITHKKNKILRKAKFNNICLLHDRYLLPDSWFKNFKKFGNYFDCVCLKNLSNEGNRFSVDWMKFHSPLTSRFKFNNALLYNEWNDEVIIPGGVMVLKEHLFKPFLLDERLHWDELEDMQLSKVAYINGILISVDSNNFFISREVRHRTYNSDWWTIKVLSKINWLKALIKNYLYFKKKVRTYFK